MKTKHITNVYIRCGRIANPTERKTTQKTTQKGGIAAQNGEIAQNIAQKNTQKNAQKEIIRLLGDKKTLLSDKQLLVLIQLYLNPQITRRELVKKIKDLTDDSAKYIIGYLQELGLLRREGGRKNGRWVVMLDIDNENRKVAEVELKRKLEQEKNKEDKA